jgi:hypothetical protein
MRQKSLSRLMDTSLRLRASPFDIGVIVERFVLFVHEAGVMTHGIKILISQPATLFATVFCPHDCRTGASASRHPISRPFDVFRGGAG